MSVNARRRPAGARFAGERVPIMRRPEWVKLFCTPMAAVCRSQTSCQTASAGSRLARSFQTRRKNKPKDWRKPKMNFFVPLWLAQIFGVSGQ